MFSKNKCASLLVSILLINCLNSQNSYQPSSFQYHPITPQIKSSDESNALGSFDFAKMDISTGVANVTIPIYSISDGPISAPVNLFYSTKGIKVDAEASWVGLGWNLYTNASIVRETKGIPDEKYKNKINTLANNNTNQTIYQWMQDMLSKCSNPNAITPYYNIYNFLINSSKYFNPCGYPLQILRDIQPDLYTLNINGEVIEFIFDYDFTVKILNNNYNYKIITVDGNSFTVLDESGNKYFFSNTDTEKIYFENTSTTNYNPTNSNTYVDLDFFTYAADYNSNTCTAYNNINTAGNPPKYKWNATSITSADSKYKINFTYEDYSFTAFDFNFIYPTDMTSLNPSFYNLPDAYTYISNLEFGIRMQQAVNRYYAKRIKKIESSEGYVSFEANTSRTDILPTGSMPPPKALDYIKIFNKNNQELKRFQFNYSYFTTTAVDSYGYRNKRLKLNSLSEFGSDLLQTKPNYTFQYDATALPVKYSYEQDFWGYYNANGATSFKGTQYYYPNYDNSNTNNNVLWSPYYLYPFSLTGSGSPTTINGNNRLPVLNKTKACVLTKITYPTGGSQIFDYELHNFCLDVDLTNRNSGGLRVKSLKVSDGVNAQKDIVKNYYYVYKDTYLPNSQNRPSGELNFMPVFGDRGTDVFTVTRIRLHKIYSHSFSGNTESSESKVFYREVKEETPGKGYTIYKFDNLGVFGKNKDLNYQSGWVIEKYKNKPILYEALLSNSAYGNMLYDNTNFPYSKEPNTNWFNGSISELDIYDNSNNLKYIKLYNYDLKSVEKIISYDFAPLLYSRLASSPSTEYFSTSISKYYYISAWRVLGDETEYLIDPAFPNNLSHAQVKTTNYAYSSSNHKFITSKTSTESNGVQVTERYKYVADYNFTNPASLNPDPASLAIIKMQQIHQLNPIIESTTEIKKGGVDYIIGGNVHTFKDLNNNVQSSVQSQNPPLVRAFEDYNLELGTPALTSSYTNANVNISGLNASFVFNSNFKRKNSNQIFDNKGNLLQSKIENGPESSILYGYNNAVPIAQVYNAKNSEIAFTSFESEEINNWNLSIPYIINWDKHTGDNAYQLKNATISQPVYYNLTRDFQANDINQEGKYIVSCWVKTSSTYTNNTCYLTIYSTDGINFGTPYPSSNSEAFKSTPITNTNGGWKYFSVVIDLYKIRSIGSLPPPPSGPHLAFRTFINNNTTNEIILVDDLRIQPYESVMSSSTYKPMIGITSETDGRNEMKLIEFDAYLRPKLLRDLNKYIIQKTDYNYKNYCAACQ